MSHTTQSPTAAPRFAAAIWTLLILAPFIAEVLSGSTRLSFLFVLIPEVMVWGAGALIARELVRRWGGGGTSLLLLGLALSVAEEFVIQQTSLAPLPFPGANAAFGRLWGVNWVYFLFMLGFESVWVVLVPVQVTELFFPLCRQQPWLRQRGLILTSIVFLVGCRIAWYGWTQQAVKRLHAPAYTVPPATIAIGIAVIATLIGLAWLLRGHGHAGRIASGNAIPAWVAAGVAILFGSVWFVLIALVFAPHPAYSAWIPIAAGVTWGLLAFALFTHTAATTAWSSMHRWALCFGTVLGCMAGTDVSSAGWSRMDLIAKYVFQLGALLGLVLLAEKIRQRQVAQPVAVD